MGEIERIRRKIKEQIEKGIEIDDSDIPVHERFVNGEEINKLRKQRRE